jgi:hypothetical protein
VRNSWKKNRGWRETKLRPWKESAIREIYMDYVRNSRKRAREFKLTQEEVSELIQKNCEYCGAGPSNLKRSRNRRSRRFNEGFLYNGIDRKDSAIGYILSNVVPCCSRCNQIKTNILSFKEMIAVAKALKKL